MSISEKVRRGIEVGCRDHRRNQARREARARHCPQDRSQRIQAQTSAAMPARDDKGIRDRKASADCATVRRAVNPQRHHQTKQPDRSPIAAMRWLSRVSFSGETRNPLTVSAVTRRGSGQIGDAGQCTGVLAGCVTFLKRKTVGTQNKLIRAIHRKLSTNAQTLACWTSVW